ncbi:MAG: hypothetical protein KAS32_01360 [Candidatus Peribacteraceae bacterium]|nr:hypothetical protein [Candidatus Peribacteraceae bacterium]
MKRRGFFKQLGLGVVATVVAPIMLRGQIETVTPNIRWVKCGENYLWYFNQELLAQQKFNNMMEEQFFHYGKMNINEFLNKVSYE